MVLIIVSLTIDESLILVDHGIDFEVRLLDRKARLSFEMLQRVYSMLYLLPNTSLLVQSKVHVFNV